MRLFLASFVRINGYTQLRQTLSPYVVGSWVKPANLHLTYIFIGEHPDDANIIKRLSRYGEFNHQLVFTSLKILNKRIICIGIQSDGILKQMYSRLYRDLGDIIQPPSKSFRPHITCCRIKQADTSALRKAVAAYQPQSFGVQPSFTASLVGSKLTNSGPKYKVLKQL